MCSLLPLHRVMKQSVGFWGWFSFFPRKIFPLFFLNLPQIFTSESNTKQTNQWDELSWLQHGADGTNNSKGVGLIPFWAIYWRVWLDDPYGSTPNQNIPWSCTHKINVPSAGLVVSSMTQQQNQTGGLYPPKCALLGSLNAHSSRKASLFLGKQFPSSFSPLLMYILQCIPKGHPRRHHS